MESADSSDLEETNGALLDSADSTVITSKASLHPRKRPTYRESPCLDEELPVFAATSNLSVVDQPASTHQLTSSKEPSPFDLAKPKLPVPRPIQRIRRLSQFKLGVNTSGLQQILKQDTTAFVRMF